MYSIQSLTIFYFFDLFLFLAALGLHCYAWAFSSFSKQRLLSSCSAQASHCNDFSCCRAQALGLMGFSSCSSQALEHRLSSLGTWAWLL